MMCAFFRRSNEKCFEILRLFLCLVFFSDQVLQTPREVLWRTPRSHRVTVRVTNCGRSLGLTLWALEATMLIPRWPILNSWLSPRHHSPICGQCIFSAAKRASKCLRSRQSIARSYLLKHVEPWSTKEWVSTTRTAPLRTFYCLHNHDNSMR